jgi:DNA-binding LacI/PurR family transcriptional regulator
MRKGRPTQADVARAAGVSQTTVSIVLNRAKPENVRLAESTRKRVLDALEQTGYIVNPIARSLAGHRTNIIGVFGFEPVFGASTDSFYLPFMEGIEQAAEASARDLLLFTSAARDGSQHHIYRQNENRLRLVDACVLMGNGEPQMELSRLAAEGYPFVFVGRREVPGIEVPYVTADYFAATRDVVARLRELGHRSIIYIAASRGLPSSVERLDAVRASVAEFGLESTILYNDRPDYLDAMRDSIAGGATAITIEPLVDLESVADRLEELGLRLPADVSVAVLGDPINPTRSPRYWSGYHLPRQEMGRGAVELLLEMLDSPAVPVRQRVIACMVETGKTVGPPRADSTPVFAR